MQNVSKRNRVAVMVAALGVIGGLGVGQASGATLVDWVATTGGSFGNTANWSTAAVPGSNDVPLFPTVLPAGTSTITLDGNREVHGVRIAPGTGKTVSIAAGTPTTSRLTLLSTDTASDGVSTFFAFSVENGANNSINVPVQLGNGSSGSFVASFNSFVNASNFVFNGTITESPGQTWGVRITGNGTGIVNYASTAKAYSGDTTIAAGGILKLNSNDQVPDGAGRGNLVIEGNGQFQLNNANETINGLSSTSTTALVTKFGSNSRSLTVGAGDASASYAGNITMSGGTTTTVNKIGLGTQTLSGSVTTPGAGSVTGGRLNINGTWSAGVNVGANGTLGGTGSISGAVAGAGTVSPGMSIGTLTVGSANLAAGGILAIEADGTGSGSADLLRATGVLNLTTTNLNVSVLSTLNDPSYIIATYGSLTGTFAGVTGLPANYEVQYSFGGNNIALVLIPEPATLGLLASVGLLALRRR